MTRALRLLHITSVLVRHGLDDLVLALHLFRPWGWMQHLMPWRWRARVRLPRGQRLREALEELGPIFVKFGQMLSTRPDLLPEDIAAELARLQDRVPPFDGEEAVKIIERTFGRPVHQLYAEFSREPVASASVAQVHLARLHDGSEVAVKVLRPGIEGTIRRDVSLLYAIAGMAARHWRIARRLRPVEVVAEFARSLDDELDLMREAANASLLRHNFENSPLLYVPQIHWDYTRSQVMTMERIEGIPIGQVEALREAGIDMRRLAHNGVEIFFTQAFRDGFFHADMHPGNIFVSRDGQYRAVDFGIMGTLSDRDKQYLAENFLAFFNRDYKAVADAHVRAGWVPSHTRVEDFEAAIRTVCEPIFSRPLSEISFGRLLVRLFQTAQRFDMEVQPQLVLLQKTLLNIEGLGRRLYPQLDLWETAKPFLEKWTCDHYGPRALLAGLKRDAPLWWRIAPELPGLLHDYLKNGRDAQREQEARAGAREELRRGFQKLFLGVVGSGFLVAAAALAAFDASSMRLLFNAPPLMTWFLGVSGLLILILAAGRPED